MRLVFGLKIPAASANTQHLSNDVHEIDQCALPAAAHYAILLVMDSDVGILRDKVRQQSPHLAAFAPTHRLLCLADCDGRVEQHIDDRAIIALPSHATYQFPANTLNSLRIARPHRLDLEHKYRSPRCEVLK